MRETYLYQRPFFWLLLVLLAAGVITLESWRGSRRPSDDAEDFKPRRHIIPQPAVTELNVVSAAEAGEKLADDDLVLAVAIGGESRAYPLKMMEGEPRTKVLNDALGGTAIAVTWCEACASAAVYERVVNGKQLTMQVFGSLWRDSLVVYDQETGSQWSQWDGKARLGPLTGETLPRVASAVVAWSVWKTRHPDGTVVLLEKEQPVFDAKMYAAAENYVLVVGAGGSGDGAKAKAWDIAEVRERGVINDNWDGTPIAVVFLQSSGTARVFERSMNGGVVTLTLALGVLHDKETKRRWDAASGAPLCDLQADALKEGSLKAVPSLVTTRSAWKLFAR